MTGSEFVDLARQLRELGAIQLEVGVEGAFRATFAPPTPPAPVAAPVVVSRRPEPPRELDAPRSARAAYRDSVREQLSG